MRPTCCIFLSLLSKALADEVIATFQTFSGSNCDGEASDIENIYEEGKCIANDDHHSYMLLYDDSIISGMVIFWGDGGCGGGAMLPVYYDDILHNECVNVNTGHNWVSTELSLASKKADRNSSIPAPKFLAKRAPVAATFQSFSGNHCDADASDVENIYEAEAACFGNANRHSYILKYSDDDSSYRGSVGLVPSEQCNKEDLWTISRDDDIVQNECVHVNTGQDWVSTNIYLEKKAPVLLTKRDDPIATFQTFSDGDCKWDPSDIEDIYEAEPTCIENDNRHSYMLKYDDSVFGGSVAFCANDHCDIDDWWTTFKDDDIGRNECVEVNTGHNWVSTHFYIEKKHKAGRNSSTDSAD